MRKIHVFIPLGITLVLCFCDIVQAQSWEQVAPILLARERPDCALLPDGKILLIGGEIQPTAISECEIYDPKSDKWTVTGSLNTARFWFAHTALLDGRIFVAGGWTLSNSRPTNTCEIYDPKTGSWKNTASMVRTRCQFQAITLPDGKVLLLGGTDTTSSDLTNLAEEFDPATETMTTVDNPQSSCYGYELAYSPTLNGIVAAGGVFQLSIQPAVGLVQLFDLSTSKWKLLNPLIEIEEGYNQLVQTPEGKLALMAGRNANKTTTKRVQVFNPDSSSWSTGGFLPYGHDYGSSFELQGDSIITIGGLNIPGNYNTIEACDIIDLKTGNSWIGPTPNVNRTSQAAIMTTSQDSLNCAETKSIYLISGEAALLGYTNSCERLTYTFSRGSYKKLSISSAFRIYQSTCSEVDTSIAFQISGCNLDSTSLDSAWLSGSQNFTLSNNGLFHRLFANTDSILINYSGNNGSDTAQLHLQYDRGNLDTTVILIGTVSPFASEISQLHRESSSAFYTQVDSLPMTIDLSSKINIDSLWPYITEIQASYTWDSSIASFESYDPPSGWTLNSIANHRNAVDIDIQNGGSAATNPLLLGTALFKPRNDQINTTWVELPQLTLFVNGEPMPVCVTENEDNHWAIKTLGVPSGVREVPIEDNEISVYPNPASDDLFIHNPSAASVMITLYDAIGREVLHVNIDGNITSKISLNNLLPSSYLLIYQIGGKIESKNVIKIK